jgi:predicted Zn-dependent peptidase
MIRKKLPAGALPEHMMFKGTHKYGTLNWEKEKCTLDQLLQLSKAHNVGKEAKMRIYEQIDSVLYYGI